MKRTVALLLSLCMLFTLAACGNTVDRESESSVSDTAITDSGNETEVSKSVPTGETETVGESTNTETDKAEQPTKNPSSSQGGSADSSSGSGNAAKPSDTTKPSDTKTPTTPTEPSTPAETPSQPTAPKNKNLVVYFSCTGNTKAVAEKIAELCDADLYEITAAQPYTAEDLNYNNSNCRANREMNDENARPAISSQTIDLSGYDTVFIGYPIWWGTMPRIINTFLDTYDLSDKTVMPFCTSGGSGVSRSVSDIKKAESKADVRDGLRASGANDRNLEKWLSDNNIK